MRVGPTKYNKAGGEVAWSRYIESGETAIVILDENGQPGLKATVALWPPSPVAEEGYVWLKGWSENEGAPQALAAAGVVELLPIFEPTGHAMAQKARLTPAALADRNASRTFQAATAAWEGKEQGR